MPDDHDIVVTHPPPPGGPNPYDHDFAMRIEGGVVADWACCPHPEGIAVAREAAADGLPTGISRDGDEWFVIGSAGQGPFVVWDSVRDCTCGVQRAYTYGSVRAYESVLGRQWGRPVVAKRGAGADHPGGAVWETVEQVGAVLQGLGAGRWGIGDLGGIYAVVLPATLADCTSRGSDGTRRLLDPAPIDRLRGDEIWAELGETPECPDVIERVRALGGRVGIGAWGIWSWFTSGYPRERDDGVELVWPGMGEDDPRRAISESFYRRRD